MKKINISILSALIGIVCGVGIVKKNMLKKNQKIQGMSDKHLSLFLMMNQWVKIKQENKKLEEYFEENGFNVIAIYGMSYVGETLLNELRNTKVNVVYGIDKNKNTIYTDVNIVSLDEELEEVDAIIVTAITYFDEIKEKLLNKVKCPIISLEDILYEI